MLVNIYFAVYLKVYMSSINNLREASSRENSYKHFCYMNPKNVKFIKEFTFHCTPCLTIYGIEDFDKMSQYLERRAIPLVLGIKLKTYFLYKLVCPKCLGLINVDRNSLSGRLLSKSGNINSFNRGTRLRLAKQYEEAQKRWKSIIQK
jgi:hypothetical protein